MIDNKKQWFLLILATIWLFLALAITTSFLLITQDARSFGLTALTAPPIAMLRQIYRYHFPPSAADYALQKLKLQAKRDQRRQRARRG
jgi:hypothetical protein